MTLAQELFGEQQAPTKNDYKVTLAVLPTANALPTLKKWAATISAEAENINFWTTNGTSEDATSGIEVHVLADKK